MAFLWLGRRQHLCGTPEVQGGSLLYRLDYSSLQGGLVQRGDSPWAHGILEIYRRKYNKCLESWEWGRPSMSLSFFQPYFIFFYYNRFAMFCQFLLFSKVTQLYIYIYSHRHTHTHSFSIIFYRVLSQVIGNSSLCKKVGYHCLSILNVIVGIH